MVLGHSGNLKRDRRLILRWRLPSWPLWGSSVPCNIVTFTYKVAASLTATSKNHVAVNGNYQSDTTDLLPGMVIRTGFWVAARMHAGAAGRSTTIDVCQSTAFCVLTTLVVGRTRKFRSLSQKKSQVFSQQNKHFSNSKMTFAIRFFSPFGEIDSCSISLSYECHWSTSMQQTEDRFCERPNPLETCVLVVFSWRWIVPCMFTALLAF